ncbi:MAG: putative ribonucleoside-diphosphate reductase subunit alpha [Prokaryotic dsDNA virus sp.]|jgi:ribonucleoside-diphosphate reductase alpha chain|nr:MAG: putative ribonucleoside-diphosphate reductase subunit alpha [Prokaryotic dsDNA virus sp.]|tara:strand:+ start:65870 stop:67549 length:1680 start_codon:yes stop_codon:yes gene_type:complete
MYDKLSEERKKLQEQGLAPAWWSTGGYQLFKEKYLYQADNPKEQYMRIAGTLSAHTPDPLKWKEIFFDLMWKGWLSPSTPVLANTGTNRGLPVSCAGSYVGDSIDEIYKARHETSMLTKMGFGTAGYLGDIRARGSDISVGGKTSGVLPVLSLFQKDMEYVAQGTARRGSWAGYLPIDHGDFYEVAKYLETEPDGNNIGWNVSADFIDRILDGDRDALDRYQTAMRTKMVTGKGYFFFPDKANLKRPQWYVDHGLDIKAPQLCNEIILHSGPDYTYTCVLASMNLMFYDDWKDTDAVFQAIVFLDCVVQEFLERGKNIPGLEKAIAATKKGRALGLGVCGLHTLFQKKRLPFGGLEAHMLNNTIFKNIRSEAERATKWLAEQWGEPDWCKGYNRANTHLLAVAPTKSTALIMGGVSEGINPDTAMVYTQRTPAGEIDRVNPVLLELMKERGVFNRANVEDIRDNMGSVQHVDWLTDEEKEVFKTAFEINQFDVIRLAAARGKHLDQWQSLNLFFAAGEDEDYISQVHKEAFLNPDILGLYYVYSKAGIQASKGECAACQ